MTLFLLLILFNPNYPVEFVTIPESSKILGVPARFYDEEMATPVTNRKVKEKFEMAVISYRSRISNANLELNSGFAFSQNNDSLKTRFTINYSTGLNGYMNKPSGGNTYQNSYYNQFSIGLRKPIFKKDDFIGFYISLINRGIRRNIYPGNPFLSELKNRFNNYFLVLKAEGGFYFYKNWHFMELIGIEYLFQSSQYSDSDFNAFRGIKKINLSFESSVGKDFIHFPRIVFVLDLIGGFTLIRPRYIYIGPKVGIFFKEQQIKPGHKPSF